MLGLFKGAPFQQQRQLGSLKCCIAIKKKDQVGTTDYDQRGRDSVFCGAIWPTFDIPGIWTPGPGESITNMNRDERYSKWKQCMFDKGYIMIDCGRDRETTLCK